MDNAVIIKSSKHGITLILDESMEFEELKSLIKNKFEQSSKFFGEADMVLAFEGKKLDVSMQQEVLEIIGSVTSINVTCIVDEDEELDAKFNAAKDKKNASAASELFYKGTLRAGQILETESSVIVLGDVNPGGKIVSKGNVVVLGNLRGTVYAGAGGNENAFVVALDMNPMQIKIADTIARSSDSTFVKVMKKKKDKDIQPKIAYIYDANIYVEDLSQEVLEDIKID
ncbi:MAG: septum site-determining protein MinC [Lachnospira sp.]|nr:septum site-determining protein MinC [Lachnospira sp.]